VRFVTIDFETYYDDQYSLSKLSTEDYVNDPRFEVILVGIKIGNEPKYWITGTKKEIKAHFDTLALQECAILGHHMMFDGLVLVVHFGIVPFMYCDTRLLAQAQLKPFLRSVSLKSCLEHLNLGVRKGDEVINMKGRTRASLSKYELEKYALYCLDDVEGTFRLFKYLAPQFPREELEIIDMILRMYLLPQLELDANHLAVHLAEVRAKKEQALNSLPHDVQKSDLMSNPKFAAVLERYGVDVPTKISPTTGAVTFAFSKNDTGWKELEDEWADDPVVSAILAARLSSKSTLEESRSMRLLDIANRYPKFRVPLLYYAAHTGRLGGTEGINPQNFPRIDKSKMRFGIKAPKGYVVLAADLAQIEARITAWLAGQKDLLQAFREKRDIYAEFASEALGREIVKGRSKEDNKWRFVGKTCVLGLGFGMSAKKLQATLRKDGVILTLEECERFVNIYRVRKYPKIPALWHTFENYLSMMASGQARAKVGPVTLAKHSVILPNGMAIVYNNLRWLQNEKFNGWVYNFGGMIRTMWGGKETENIAQALARIMVMQYALQIKHTIGLYPALQQHDELDYVVREQYAVKVAAVIGKIIRVSPTWAPDLPVEVEINYGPSLGDCK
jgi:DNA polymerase I-like protein with 3'-5' exonuclease and polymerase domains